MAAVGDRIQVTSVKVGQLPREGVVVATSGNLLRVKWSSGEESTVVPGPGTLLVVGKARGASGKKVAKAAPAAKASKPGKKSASGKKVAKAAPAAKASKPGKKSASGKKVAKAAPAAKASKPPKKSASGKKQARSR